VDTSSIKLLTLQAVCAALSVSRCTIKRWRKAGTFPEPIRLQRGAPLRWRLRDIESFIDRRQRQRLKAAPRGAACSAPKAANDEI